MCPVPHIVEILIVMIDEPEPVTRKSYLDGLAAVNGDSAEVADGGVRGVRVDHRNFGPPFEGKLEDWNHISFDIIFA